jgi:glycosyltransferase involved in cell wall biosynthesis
MKKINVLQFICPSGFYGAEMWVLAIAKSLDKSRVRCLLAVTKESESQNLELYNRVKALGFEAELVPMHGRFDISGVLRLRKLIKDKEIHIIHTHGYKSDIFGLMAARIAGIKALATPHGFENSPDRKLQLYIKLGCRALRYFDRVAPLSEELQSDLKRLGIRPEKIRLIINGVDLEEIEEARNKYVPPLTKDSSDKRIAYIGQMAFRKNVEAMLDAFNLLWQDHPEARLILVGDGTQRNYLESKARSMPCSDKIEFLGYRKDRLELLMGMDLFTMTSSLEGIPRCMMEAMALGIPVAAFNIPGVDKLIHHEKTGLMADFGQIKDLKLCWERILFDKPFASELADNGRKFVMENFSAGRMAEEYISVYRELMQG